MEQREKILIVDDERLNISLLMAQLNQDYDIMVAMDGEQALVNVHSATPPDLILLDICLPGMDGFEVCRIIKSDPKTQEIPIIFVTAMLEEAQEQQGFAIGAVDYITKPCSVSIIQARVKTHLALRKAQAELYLHATTLEDRVEQRTQELYCAKQQIGTLVELGLSLSSARSIDVLLDTALKEAIRLCHTDGGTLYLVNDKQHLEFFLTHNHSLGITSADKDRLQDIFSNIPMFDLDGSPNRTHMVAYAATIGKELDIDDVYASKKYNFSGSKRFDRIANYKTRSLLCVPMKTMAGEVLGVIQLVNPMHSETGELVTFQEVDTAPVQVMAAQAAVALENHQLLDERKKLLDSFIKLIANAIDIKSPYTAGHCKRVPILTEMLAKAVCHSSEPPFTDFQLNKEQMYELKIASWLHDCGKVTTPEHVVDKATKLEAIYNRIHDIRMRFEVLWRDAHLDSLQRRMAGEDVEMVAQQLAERQGQLQEDFAFIAQCNVGGEFMEDDDIERLQALAHVTWKRYFCNKQGLSIAEQNQVAHLPEVKLPVEEPLLADRKEHLLPRGNAEQVMWMNEKYTANRKVPKYENNLGELYNLSIRRGTLNDEERFRVNDHIVQTIAMLEQLPFPQEMRHVPEYAGGHHEKLDGSGYPQSLSKSQLSLPARMMGIADIFEALTAADRPYKTPKTLSEALNIMGWMQKNQHIDADLFRLFVSSGIYQEYADQYLLPHQLDEVKLEDIPGWNG